MLFILPSYLEHKFLHIWKVSPGGGSWWLYQFMFRSWSLIVIHKFEILCSSVRMWIINVNLSNKHDVKHLKLEKKQFLFIFHKYTQMSISSSLVEFITLLLFVSSNIKFVQLYWLIINPCLLRTDSERRATHGLDKREQVSSNSQRPWGEFSRKLRNRRFAKYYYIWILQICKWLKSVYGYNLFRLPFSQQLIKKYCIYIVTHVNIFYYYIV